MLAQVPSSPCLPWKGWAMLRGHFSAEPPKLLPAFPRRILLRRRECCLRGVDVNYPARVPHSWIGGWSFFSLPYIRTDLQTWLRSFVCLVMIEQWGLTLPQSPAPHHSKSVLWHSFVWIQERDQAGWMIIGLILHSFHSKIQSLRMPDLLLCRLVRHLQKVFHSPS